MAREQRLRRALACSVLVGVLIAVSTGVRARAADSDRPDGAAPHSGCPDSEAVWSTVMALVPSAAASLLAAQPHVEIVDLGDRYRVRVTTDGGVLERTYADPDRDCEKRQRFAAEFIVVSLLPPELAIGRTAPSATSAPGPTTVPSSTPTPSATAAPSATPAASASTAPASPAPTTTPAPRAPPPPQPPVAPPAPAETSEQERLVAASEQRTRAAFARIEISALGEGSAPVFRAPSFIAWGADLRVRLGDGRFTGIAGVSYWPKTDFVTGGVRASVTRIPVVFGARARAAARYIELAGDVGIAIAYERYDGVSPHDAAGAARVVPGLEASLIVSSRALVGFAPFVGLRVDWLPPLEELAAAPQGNLGNAPALWIGVALGLSWEP